MGSEFVLSLNEKEKAFIEQYQDLVIDNNGDEKVINGILKYIAKDVKDYDNLIKIVYSEVKKKLFNEKYKRDYSPAFNLKNEFIKFIKESNINFTQQRLLFSFPKPANYSNVKFRDKYLLSSGDDGIVRIWIFDKNKDDFFLFGEYGEKQNKEANFDLLNEYLFYSKDKLLIVYNIFSEKIVTKKEFAENIEAIEFKNDKIIVYSNKIATNYIIKNNELFSNEANLYKELPLKTNFVKITKTHNATIFRNSVLFAENNKDIENTGEIKVNNHPFIVKEKNQNFLTITDVRKYLLQIFIFYKNNKAISLNPILPIYGVQKFDDYLIIYYKNGNEICFNKDGEIKFKTSTENKDLNIKYLNLQQPKINFYAFENDFIIEKNGFYYGSKNWKNYLYFIENDKICLNNEGYDYYFDSITKKELFKEI